MNKSSGSSSVTLRDVAREMKVSHSTVSRALQNSPHISLARRKEIHEAAKRMGYHPNAQATQLGYQRHASQKRPIGSEIAWLNFWPDPQKLRSFHEFDLYWKGASERAEENGYRLEEFNCGGEISPSRIEKILLARNIQGILLPPHGGYHFPPGWDKISWDKFSVVRFGYSVTYPRAHLVTSNHLTSAILAIENMWRLGYKRIGFVAIPHINFQAGFLLKQMTQVKNQPPICTFLSGEEHLSTDNHLAKLPEFSKWLEKNHLDAILTDLCETRTMLDKLGYRVPEDIGLAATSVLDGNANAGINQNSEEIGRAAFETLLSLLNHNQHGIPEIVREVLVTGSWVDGTSLPPRSQA